MTELEDQLNEALAHNLPKGLGQSPLEVALDLKLIPYWGEPQEGEEDFLIKGKPRRGTSTFFGYASLYVIKKNKRFTLAMVAVRRGAGTGRCLAPAVGTLAQARVWPALSLPRPSVVVHRFPFALSALWGKYRRQFGIESSHRVWEQNRRGRRPDGLAPGWSALAAGGDRACRYS